MKVLQEVLLQKKMKHINVIRLYEIFESPQNIYIVMEYAANGDLLEYVKKKGKLAESEVRKLFKGIVYGLAHIHCRNVIHRDIKLDNIFLDNENNPKIGDFGVSRQITKFEEMDEQCGTPAYLAPEIIENQGYEGFYADRWSLGIVLYAMACAAVPYKAENLESLGKTIRSTTIGFPCKLSSDLKDLIHGLLEIEPKERFSIPEILAHPWMQADKTGGANTESDEEIMNMCTELEAAINIDNLFDDSKQDQKLSLDDYKRIAGDFLHKKTSQGAIKQLEKFGYPREIVNKSLKNEEINHATASYFILTTGSNSQFS